MDGVELNTFLSSMTVATVIYFGLQHFQKNPIKSTWGKGAGLVIVGAYVLLSLYYTTEVIESAKTMVEA